jgi:hypothetical protein
MLMMVNSVVDNLIRIIDYASLVVVNDEWWLLNGI